MFQRKVRKGLASSAAAQGKTERKDLKHRLKKYAKAVWGLVGVKSLRLLFFLYSPKIATTLLQT